MTVPINGNRVVYTIAQGDNLTKISKRFNTDIERILELNPSIGDKNLIVTGKTLILDNNEMFIQKEDYSPDNMNVGSIKINGEEITQINGKNVKSNFYANDLGALSSVSLSDNDYPTKIVIEMQAGKSMTRKDNDTPYSILNKAIANHLDDNSTIVNDDNGKLSLKSQRLEQTDLYKAFISEDINGDNFTGEDNKLLSRGVRGNNVQIPAVKIDKNGVKYFTLHGKDGEVLYFDATGKKVSYENGLITGASRSSTPVNPEINDEAEGVSQTSVDEFIPYSDYNEKALNVGKVFLNGKEENFGNLKSNFYQNNINVFMEQTLNDDRLASRLDIQLNLGNQISLRDTSAVDLLKKILGNNFNKSSVVVPTGDGDYNIVNPELKDTDIYKAFVSAEVNGQNFSQDNNIVRNESGFNIVQFPSLETDANGHKFYTLHTLNGAVLYFNDSGKQIK